MCPSHDLESSLSNPTGNPIRGAFHAWFLANSQKTMHRLYGERKQKLFANLAGQVLEIGPGTGSNFPYFPQSLDVIGIEPNPKMHDRLRASAQEQQINLDIQARGAENLAGIAADSIDTVVGTLVLCSVTHPERAIAEILRVLKPGGRYVFIEHVAAPPRTLLRMMQELLLKPWRWWFEGCNLNRETGQLLSEADFSQVDLDSFKLKLPLVPFAPQIAGVAVK